jgi:hypothetical protein
VPRSDINECIAMTVCNLVAVSVLRVSPLWCLFGLFSQPCAEHGHIFFLDVSARCYCETCPEQKHRLQGVFLAALCSRVIFIAREPSELTMNTADDDF